MVRIVISDIAEIASLGAFLTAVVIFAQVFGGMA
jgi:hypothetical protein